MPLAEPEPAVRCAGRRAGFRAGPAAGCLSPLSSFIPPHRGKGLPSLFLPPLGSLCVRKKKKLRPQVPCRGWRLEERGCMPPTSCALLPPPLTPHFFLLSCAGYFEAISPVCVQGLEGGRAESRSANLSGCVGGRGRRQKGPASK